MSSSGARIRISVESRSFASSSDQRSIAIHLAADAPRSAPRYRQETMTTRSRVRAVLLDPRLQDGVLAVLLTVLAVLDVTAVSLSSSPRFAVAEDVGPGPVVVAAALLVALPVALRRRFPLGALAFALSVIVGQAAADAGLSEQATFALPGLILIYSVATYGSGLHAWIGLVLAVGGLSVATSIESERGYQHGPGDYAFGALSVVAVWLFGYALRGRARRIAGLEDETARLAREREERARAAVTAERARIARDLHDVVAHNVSVMVVQAAAAEEMLSLDPERARAPLLAIQETGTQALTEMRRLLGIMRAADEQRTLGREPGLASLEALAVEFRDAGLPVELTVEGDRRQLPSGVDLAAYRVVEEALTNALKHARGSQTRVAVRHIDGAIELEVTDDGPGPADGDGGGHGLIGMRERAALYGGTVEAGGRDGGGFVVRARLPLAAGAGMLGKG
jgi:signal transduction histidine kinase